MYYFTKKGNLKTVVSTSPKKIILLERRDLLMDEIKWIKYTLLQEKKSYNLNATR